MIKIFRGCRGSDTFKTPSPYEQLLPLPTPCFKTFLERPFNDPPTPHHPTSSILHCYPLPIHHPFPPLKILIVHLKLNNSNFQISIIFLSVPIVNEIHMVDSLSSANFKNINFLPGRSLFQGREDQEMQEKIAKTGKTMQIRYCRQFQ